MAEDSEFSLVHGRMSMPLQRPGRSSVQQSRATCILCGGQRDEPFTALSLDIKNKRSLKDALDLFAKPDFLDGDNKYHCEEYDRKIDAQKRTYIKDLSDTVLINLKRFEFDYQNMQRIKVNDYCEFPELLDFFPWTK